MFLTLVCFWCKGQNISEDLKKVNERLYKELPKSFNIKYESYQSWEMDYPEETSEAIYTVMGLRHFVLDNDFLTTIRNGDSLLLLDKEEKKIFVLKDTLDGNYLMKISLDSAIKICDSIKYEFGISNKHIYNLYPNERYSVYHIIRVEIDTKAWYIDNLVLYFNRDMPVWENNIIVAYFKPKLKIYINATDLNKDRLDALKFDKYIVKKKGKYSPTQNFSSYEVQNNL